MGNTASPGFSSSAVLSSVLSSVSSSVIAIASAGLCAVSCFSPPPRPFPPDSFGISYLISCAPLFLI